MREVTKGQFEKLFERDRVGGVTAEGLQALLEDSHMNALLELFTLTSPADTFKVVSTIYFQQLLEIETMPEALRQTFFFPVRALMRSGYSQREIVDLLQPLRATLERDNDFLKKMLLWAPMSLSYTITVLLPLESDKFVQKLLANKLLSLADEIEKDFLGGYGMRQQIILCPLSYRLQARFDQFDYRYCDNGLKRLKVAVEESSKIRLFSPLEVLFFLVGLLDYYHLIGHDPNGITRVYVDDPFRQRVLLLPYHSSSPLM